MRLRCLGQLALFAALAALTGCAEKTPPPKAEVPEVGVVTVQPRTVSIIYEQVGQTAGFRETEVRARVSGILLRRLYSEGEAVKQGQPLFQIDPEPFKAALDQTRGQLRQEETALERARTDRERIEPLFAENAVSRKDYDDARSAFESAAAAVDSARARVREAELSLGYTRVTAPISGIASKEARSEGSLVTSTGEAGLLTVISQLDPIYVNFSFSEAEKLEYDRLIAEGFVLLPATRRVEARVKLADGRDYDGVGYVDFADSRVDPKTGTIRARAEFPNPKGELLPGQFARIAINVGMYRDAIVVPERAITQQQATRLVLLVNDKRVVEARPVTLGSRVAGGILVKAGLKAGDRVIVDGLIKSRPGSEVKPVPAKAEATAADAPAMDTAQVPDAEKQ